jgi:hypothetical protein
LAVVRPLHSNKQTSSISFWACGLLARMQSRATANNPTSLRRACSSS